MASASSATINELEVLQQMMGEIQTTPTQQWNKALITKLTGAETFESGPPGGLDLRGYALQDSFIDYVSDQSGDPRFPNRKIISIALKPEAAITEKDIKKLFGAGAQTVHGQYKWLRYGNPDNEVGFYFRHDALTLVYLQREDIGTGNSPG